MVPWHRRLVDEIRLLSLGRNRDVLLQATVKVAVETVSLRAFYVVACA